MNRTVQHPLLRASNLLVHCFAAVKWQQIDGGKWKSAGGRVLSNEAYQRHQQRVGSREAKGGAKKAPAPKGAAPKPSASEAAPAGWPTGTAAWAAPEGGSAPAGPRAIAAPAKRKKKTRSGDPSAAANRAAYDRVRAGGQRLGPYAADVDYTRPITPPVKAPPLPGGQKLPDPTPAESAYITAQHGRDKQRFGAKVADFLKKATAGAVGILAGLNGMAWGAIAGSALGGPLGLALGTAVGGGLGGKLGAWGGKKILKAAKRPAKGGKRAGFAEAQPADLDPVPLIKARIRALLARQGKPSDIPIDDEPILAALALAAQDDDAQERAAALARMAEPVRGLVGASRRVRRA
ncbi:hypothetical protein GobsT_37600 [Gemmata obscuriglobus]|uniref:Uncharacterized protein n=1 Tax=Gemmata obscuriglobus TaxID=114 RepID=A0A2Z3H1D2_9BACT|nr:hypothetical protein [Gemmata obscuriglobus]AWM38142.1 hypothetical protein C1280_14825 [Gemmata obscuriglobus]QEG28971.1 hypothetical protein GobsT_37600 [Gemmata obscuriglobus]VTS07517.1 unnamed protein product [Gemmata obscuriglobus UQM 2246]